MQPADIFRLGRFLSLVMLLIILAGCHQPAGDNRMHAPGNDTLPTLRVGVAVHSPPFVFRKDGQLQGIEIDLARMLGASIGFRINFVPLDWEKLIPALEDNRIDVIMSGMTMTDQRAYRVAFTEPYMRSGQTLLVRSDEAARYRQGVFSLMGTNPRIGLVEGTTGDFFITANIHGAEKIRFKTPDEAVSALKRGKIDVLVHDAPMLRYYAAMDTSGKLFPVPQLATVEYLAWGVAKTNRELLLKLNTFLEEGNRTGNLDTTIRHWLPR
jgi:polar amino acid transport system substrate-binding protein